MLQPKSANLNNIITEPLYPIDKEELEESVNIKRDDDNILAGAISPTTLNAIFGESDIIRGDLSKFKDLGRIYPGQDFDERLAQSQSKTDRIANGFGRLLATTGTKTMEGLGYLGAMGVETASWAAGQGFDLDAALDNGFSEAFSNLEEDVKEALPIYKTNAYKNGNVLQQMGTLSFWTDDFVDGLAFMASAYVPGIAVSKLGLGAKVASTFFGKNIGHIIEGVKAGVKGTAKLSPKLNRLASLTNVMAASSMASVSEAAFEAKDFKDNFILANTDRLKGEGYSDEQINVMASEGARNTFLGNVAALMLSNTFEAKMLFDTFSGARRFTKDIARGQATQLAGKSLAKTFLYNGMKTSLAEGAFEENIQTAIQDYEELNQLGKADGTRVGNLLEGMIDNFTTREGQKAIALGAIIGFLPGGIGGTRRRKQEIRYSNNLNNVIKQNSILHSGLKNPDTSLKIDEDGKLTFNGKDVVIKNGKIIEDDPKVRENILSAIGYAKKNADMITALQMGDMKLYDALRNKRLAEWAYDYFGQEGGLEVAKNSAKAFAAETLADKQKFAKDNGTEYEATEEDTADADDRTLNELYKIYRQTQFDLYDVNLDNSPDAASFKRELSISLFLERTKSKDYNRSISEVKNEIEGLKSEILSKDGNLNHLNDKIREYNALNSVRNSYYAQERVDVFNYKKQLKAKPKSAAIKKALKDAEKRRDEAKQIADNKFKAKLDILSEEINNIDKFRTDTLAKDETKKSNYIQVSPSSVAAIGARFKQEGYIKRYAETEDSEGNAISDNSIQQDKLDDKYDNLATFLDLLSHSKLVENELTNRNNIARDFTTYSKDRTKQRDESLKEDAKELEDEFTALVDKTLQLKDDEIIGRKDLLKKGKKIPNAQKIVDAKERALREDVEEVKTKDTTEETVEVEDEVEEVEDNKYINIDSKTGIKSVNVENLSEETRTFAATTIASLDTIRNKMSEKSINVNDVKENLKSSAKIVRTILDNVKIVGEERKQYAAILEVLEYNVSLLTDDVVSRVNALQEAWDEIDAADKKAKRVLPLIGVLPEYSISGVAKTGIDEHIEKTNFVNKSEIDNYLLGVVELPTEESQQYGLQALLAELNTLDITDVFTPIAPEDEHDIIDDEQLKDITNESATETANVALLGGASIFHFTFKNKSIFTGDTALSKKATAAYLDYLKIKPGSKATLTVVDPATLPDTVNKEETIIKVTFEDAPNVESTIQTNGYLESEIEIFSTISKFEKAELKTFYSKLKNRVNIINNNTADRKSKNKAYDELLELLENMFSAEFVEKYNKLYPLVLQQHILNVLEYNNANTFNDNGLTLMQFNINEWLNKVKLDLNIIKPLRKQVEKDYKENGKTDITLNVTYLSPGTINRGSTLRNLNEVFPDTSNLTIARVLNYNVNKILNNVITGEAINLIKAEGYIPSVLYLVTKDNFSGVELAIPLYRRTLTAKEVEVAHDDIIKLINLITIDGYTMKSDEYVAAVNKIKKTINVYLNEFNEGSFDSDFREGNGIKFYTSDKENGTRTYVKIAHKAATEGKEGSYTLFTRIGEKADGAEFTKVGTSTASKVSISKTLKSILGTTFKNINYKRFNDKQTGAAALQEAIADGSIQTDINPIKDSNSNILGIVNPVGRYPLIIKVEPNYLQSEYKGIKIIYTNNIITNQNTKGAAQYNSTTNTIKIDREFLKEKYKIKVWHNPRQLYEIIDGKKIESKSAKLDDKHFPTYEIFEAFVIEHEYQHSIYSRKDFNKEFPNKLLGDYETEISRRALNQLQIEKGTAKEEGGQDITIPTIVTPKTPSETKDKPYSLDEFKDELSRLGGYAVEDTDEVVASILNIYSNKSNVETYIESVGKVNNSALFMSDRIDALDLILNSVYNNNGLTDLDVELQSDFVKAVALDEALDSFPIASQLNIDVNTPKWINSFNVILSGMVIEVSTLANKTNFPNNTQC